MSTSPQQTVGGDAHANVPRIDTVAANAPRTGDTAASPMALDSPVAHGFKRTADGSLKGTEDIEKKVNRPLAAHKRNKSMDVQSGRRIGEVRGGVSGFGMHVLTPCSYPHNSRRV